VVLFEHASDIDAPVETVFAFHERPDALPLLIPPGPLSAKLVERTGNGIQSGARVVLGLPLGIRWVAVHTNYIPGKLFVDLQQSGPFHFWEHRHIFESISPTRCRLTDSVRFSLHPFGWFDFALGWLAKIQLRSMFRYRHAVTARECEKHRP
jgi:ligand-binding SRPBCC domain-containing protein